MVCCIWIVSGLTCTPVVDVVFFCYPMFFERRQTTIGNYTAKTNSVDDVYKPEDIARLSVYMRRKQENYQRNVKTQEETKVGLNTWKYLLCVYYQNTIACI